MYLFVVYWLFIIIYLFQPEKNAAAMPTQSNLG